MRPRKIVRSLLYLKRKIRSSRPTLVLVRHGFVTVRTAGRTYCAQTGNSMLLVPGVYEIEATPAVRHGNLDVEIATFSLAALGRGLKNGSTVEALMLGVPESDNKGVYIQKRTVEILDRALAAVPMYFKDVESIVVRILNCYAASAFQFARFAFFEKRWALLSLLEAHVLRPRVVEWLGKNYVDGRAAFFRDCKLFVGITPAKWIQTRRLELARAWLQHGKARIEDIAKILSFCNARALRTALWKHYQMSIEELRDTRGLRAFGIPHVAFRPFWWPAPLPLIGEAQRPALPAGEVSELAESAPEPCDESPTDDARDLPPDDGGNTEPKPMNERFFNLEMIPVAEIIPFPAGLPELLAAA